MHLQEGIDVNEIDAEDDYYSEVSSYYEENGSDDFETLKTKIANDHAHFYIRFKNNEFEMKYTVDYKHGEERVLENWKE